MGHMHPLEACPLGLLPPALPCQAMTWLESVAHCILQAVRLGSAAGRAMLPRLLHLLSFENSVRSHRSQVAYGP